MPARTRTFPYLLATCLASGCTGLDDTVEDTSQTAQASYLVANNLWPSNFISVCFDFDGFDDKKTWVREKLTGPTSWSAHAQITFVGWFRCAPSDRGIRIRNGTGSVAYSLGPVDGTVILDLKMDIPERIRLEWEAMHEFGHALGFSHEQNRYDAPAACQALAQGQNGDTIYGPYDPDSIMNYCAPADPDLSAGDIAGVQFAYGRRPQWVPGFVANGPSSSFAISSCHKILSADIDGDNDPDLVCPTATGTFVQRLTGSTLGAWTFAGSAPPISLSQCKTLGATDVNHDGVVDLYCPANLGGGTARTFVQFGTSSGFTAWVGNAPQTFELAECVDITLLESTWGPSSLACTRRDGAGATQTWVAPSAPTPTTAPVGYGAWFAAGPNEPWSASFDAIRCKLFAGDLDLDNNPDLVCAYDNGTSTRTWVKLSSGTWAWTNVSPTASFSLSRCTKLLFHDQNGDRRPDLVCVYDTGAGTTSTKSQSANHSGYVAWSAAGPSTPADPLELFRCKDVLAANIDGDSFPDLICPYVRASGVTTAYVQPTLGGAPQFKRWIGGGPRTSAFSLSQCRGVYELRTPSFAALACPLDSGGTTRTLTMSLPR